MKMLGERELWTKTISGLLFVVLVVSMSTSLCAYSSFPNSGVEEVVAVYGETPTMDGIISIEEWDDASNVTFSVSDGQCLVYIKQNGSHLHIAFNIPDTTLWWGEGVQVVVDVDHNGGKYPQTDDFFLLVHRSSLQEEYNWTGNAWNLILDPVNWTAACSSSVDGYQIEFSISYSKIGVSADTDKTLGLALIVDDNTGAGWLSYGWPSGVNYEIPNTWGSLTSGDPYFWIPEYPSALLVIALIIIFAITYSQARLCARSKITDQF